MTWWLLLTAALAVWAGIMAIVIVLQRRSPAATIAWLLVLSFLPGLGYVVYRLIGPLRLERRKLRRRITRKVIEEAFGALDAIEHESPMRHREQLARVAFNAGEAPPLRATGLELYTEGDAAYAAIATAIGAAQHHVHLEYYIWEPDRSGKRMRDVLVACRKRGVEVRVIVDGTGSHGARRGFFDPLIAAGAEVAWFNPVSLFGLRRRRIDFRSHRKIVVCDGRVGFTGGMNVADDHAGEFSGAQAWRDTHMRFEGSSVRALQRVFVEDWLYCTEKMIELAEAYFPTPETSDGEVVQIVASGPDLAQFAIHKMYFAAINQAAERVWLTTPYFVPDDAMLSALVCAALRGVDVRLIVPAKGDSKLVDLAARSYFPELLEARAKVYEYNPRFVHAKTLVVDNDIAIVGTANCDNRSFRLDFEVAAVVYGHTLNTCLADTFTADLAHSTQVARTTGKVRFRTRLGQAGARLLSPLL